MSNIIDFNARKNELIGEKVGTVLVSMYKDKTTNKSFFSIEADNEDMLQVSYVIEDTLYYF